ncbi:phage major capsid protein [Sinorhizobium meliloti]|uniref:phage major capsid protein n=1 Tax=Rhizobium meliloti TaxID=382 RepID=UPI000FD720FD|nr:phage major capsid protein [Sinorhizobium meliloti]MDX0139341.1 phage major capsid protein [Sinorhizobium meliloti]MDX0382680.1 phage major capsid protein [Sinorhizobium meliloti]RVM51431.1 phage major capsid protein [Sinorhizobium meliloti]
MTMHNLPMTRQARAMLAAGARIQRKDAGDPFELLSEKFGEHTAEVMRKLGEADEKMAGFAARLLDIQQRADRASYAGGSGGQVPTWGDQVLRSAQFRNFADGGRNAKTRIPVETKATITSADFPVVPDADREIITQGRRPLLVRSLLGSANTTSNAISYRRETGFTNAAAPVAEGALKPESAITFEEVTAPVRTLAHWIKLSRQVLDDDAQLRSEIDTVLRYGLAFVVEGQLLHGDGTGQNLNGLIPQSTDFDETRRAAGDTAFDILLKAISQSEEADYPATGAIISTRDWYAMMGIKDTEGRYIGGGPLADIPGRVWRLPVAPSNAMPVGNFIVGALDLAAKVYSRTDATIELGYVNDDFTRNLVTVLGEERLALAVRRPEAIVYGSFTAP